MGGPDIAWLAAVFIFAAANAGGTGVVSVTIGLGDSTMAAAGSGAR